MKKVGLISLGCCKNLVDSEMMLSFFLRHGYELTNDPKQADYIVINTCGFIKESKEESINNIFDMLSYKKKVIVTGCLSERYEKDLASLLPEVDLFIPINKYNHFGKYWEMVDPTYDGGDEPLDLAKRYLTSKPYSAYLRIADGCSNCCTYCAIPLIRGPIKSVPIDELYKQALDLKNQGIKELVLIAQDTTKYGLDLKDGANIEKLLKKLLTIKEFTFIRLLYLYPDEISDELIDLFKNEARLTPYFDIPIQHSETHILKDMNRRGNKSYLRKLFHKIKSRVPNAILRTTLMVGFPGETRKDIDNLISFLKEIRFDHVGCFTYSKEDDTKSYYFKNQINKATKNRRKRRVMEVQGQISYENNLKRIGEIYHGLVDGYQGDKYLLRCAWNAPDDIDGNIIFESDDKLNIGDEVDVLITSALKYDLIGKKCNI